MLGPGMGRLRAARAATPFRDSKVGKAKSFLSWFTVALGRSVIANTGSALRCRDDEKPSAGPSAPVPHTGFLLETEYPCSKEGS